MGQLLGQPRKEWLSLGILSFLLEAQEALPSMTLMRDNKLPRLSKSAASLLAGTRLTTIRRHLGTAFGLIPQPVCPWPGLACRHLRHHPVQVAGWDIICS
jgi:hypothetical protein